MKKIMTVLVLLGSLNAYAGNCKVYVIEGDLSGTTTKMLNKTESAFVKKGYEIAYNSDDATLIVAVDTMSDWDTQECLAAVLARVTITDKNDKRIFIEQKDGCYGHFFGKIRRTLMLRSVLKQVPAPQELCGQ